VNDTVLIADPKTDPDAGPFFQRLPVADFPSTWYSQRINDVSRPQEQDAARKAAAHANTPATTFFDALGRTFLTAAFNRYVPQGSQVPVEEFSRTFVAIDIEGNQRSVTDALGRQVMVYDYDILGTRLHQNSVDAGERWMLNDVLGKPLLSWDSRDHR